MNRYKMGKLKGGSFLFEILIWYSVKIKVRFLEKKRRERKKK